MNASPLLTAGEIDTYVDWMKYTCDALRATISALEAEDRGPYGDGVLSGLRSRLEATQKLQQYFLFPAPIERGKAKLAEALLDSSERARDAALRYINLMTMTTPGSSCEHRDL